MKEECARVLLEASLVHLEAKANGMKMLRGTSAEVYYTQIIEVINDIKNYLASVQDNP